ncbi:MAG: hypothetical protein SO364_01995 [Sodaliphilus sp.]|nr:hypothetical protein [Sodaliphilus sp.]
MKYHVPTRFFRQKAVFYDFVLVPSIFPLNRDYAALKKAPY